MAPIKAKRAWAVAYSPQYLLEMAEEYDQEALQQLNEHLERDDYAVISDDTQGFAGDLIIDFPNSSPEPYRALIMLA